MTTSNPRRDRLEDELSAAYREVDKILVSVAAGVIAVSVAFVGNIPTPVDTWTIRTAWVLMIGTVLSVLVSLLCEQGDRRRRLDANHRRIAETDGTLTKAIKYLNWTSIATFIAGLAAMGWFLWVNTN